MWKAKSRWRSLRDDWIKLKRLKYELKILNTKEFQGIEAKISATQTKLLDIQDQMQHPGDHQRLFNLHNGIKEELESWYKVQESAYRLKARVNWLKLGDSISAYFHACLRNRIA